MVNKETYRKLIQIGRVVYLNEGKYKGKLATIVDIIDSNKALIDGPCTKVPRQGFKFSEMHLTKYQLKVNRSQRSRVLRGLWKDAGITEKFNQSNWNKNLGKGELRDGMTDYDLYKLGRCRQARNKRLNHSFFGIKNKKRLAVNAKRKANREKKMPKK